MSVRTFALLTAAGLALPASAHGQDAPAAHIDIRLGMVAAELSEGQARRYQQLLASLREPSARSVRARVAPGTYAEVLNWLDRGLIDAAVLTPALYAETLKKPAPGGHRGHAPCRYLATEGATPSPGRDPFRYRPVCLVRKGSPLSRFDDLKKAALERRVRFLLVDRLSASGHLAQRYALLKGAGVVLREDQIEYTYSHAACLGRLAQGTENGQELAAFVSDDATSRGSAAGAAAFDRVNDFPGLDTSEYAIPQDVWVTRPGFAHFDLLRQLLKNRTDKDGRRLAFDREELDRPLYERIGRWTDELGAAADKPASLDEIASLLRHYRRRYAGDGEPRLALVFSGGGAKCSYQAGAVQEIEKKLGGDISLVVGTSGGAINAVPVALGVTRDDPELLAREWLELDLREVARPALGGCVLLGVLAACVLVLLWSAVWWLVRDRRALVRWPASLAVPVAWLVLPWVSSEWIDRQDWLRYLQIVLRFGFLWASVVLLAFVVVAGFRWARVRVVLAAAGLTGLASLVALPLALAFGSETLFSQEGMEATFARRYTNLTRGALGDLSIPEGTRDQQRLRALSRGIVARIGAPDNPLKRDLVVTGSCLPPRPPGLQSSDLYFYLPAAKGGPGREPRYGAEGVALAEHPDILMDVVMGSGTIYPGFPASTIKDFPDRGARVKLIDGGFAHNSPVEAAVEWGATHILLIEASPKSEQEREHETEAGGEPPPAHSLWHNAGDAFNHLYDQAQLLDVRSREKVAIFTLRPATWHLTVIDFSRGKMREAIEAGKRDAAGANFERQHGEPRFLEAPEPKSG